MTECCVGGHSDTNEHSHHSPSGSSGDDQCLVENSSLFSFAQNETANYRPVSSHHDHHPHAHLFLALCCLAAVASLFEAESANGSPGYGEPYVCLYRSVNANRDNGLRAPPCFTV
ncbi:MAG: hypothetical protein LBP98_06255 [Tannerella sp.]|nr:hypothetical protein [Tannerella sp.]